MQKFDRDAVRRADEGHVAVARRAIDGHAIVRQPPASLVDIVDLVSEMAEVSAAAVATLIPVVRELDFAALIAGYAEGIPEQLIMRPLDVLMAFPAILLAIALMSVFGTGALLVSVSLAVVYTPIVARVVRAAVLATKVEVYVDGARALGATVPRLVLAHILPNAATPILVQASVLMAIGILVEAALSFLGVGVRPPTLKHGHAIALFRQPQGGNAPTEARPDDDPVMIQRGIGGAAHGDSSGGCRNRITSLS